MKTQVSALAALATHLEVVSKNARSHGGHGWTYDEEIEMLRTAADELKSMRSALTDIVGIWERKSEACADNSDVAFEMAQRGRAALSNKGDLAT